MVVRVRNGVVRLGTLRVENRGARRKTLLRHDAGRRMNCSSWCQSTSNLGVQRCCNTLPVSNAGRSQRGQARILCDLMRRLQT